MNARLKLRELILQALCNDIEPEVDEISNDVAQAQPARLINRRAVFPNVAGNNAGHVDIEARL